jgi:hypothetical protein
MNIISFAEIAKHIDAGLPFRARLVTFDRKRKKGGDLLDIEAVLAKEPYKTRPDTPRENMRGRVHNNFKHYTRNVALMQAGHRTYVLQKVHIPLFILFEGKQVTP